VRVWAKSSDLEHRPCRFAAHPRSPPPPPPRRAPHRAPPSADASPARCAFFSAAATGAAIVVVIVLRVRPDRHGLFVPQAVGHRPAEPGTLQPGRDARSPSSTPSCCAGVNSHRANLKCTGLIHNLGQLIGIFVESGSTNRDFLSNCWVNLQILGQPCEFYLVGSRPSLADRVLCGELSCASCLAAAATTLARLAAATTLRSPRSLGSSTSPPGRLRGTPGTCVGGIQGSRWWQASWHPHQMELFGEPSGRGGSGRM
jgi:hypothetical protein